MDNQGKLYICPTPIGNLEDMTLRVLRTLKEVDLIAAEDTRHTKKLLTHFDIHTPLFSYHEHNKMKAGPVLINKMLEGLSVAIVTDAGTPGISDPGEELIGLAIEEKIGVVSQPGATAFVTALVASGLPTGRFVFEGFLDRHKKKRKLALEALSGEERTLILYEAPHRLNQTLQSILEVLGDRQMTAARELTKKYESYTRGRVSSVIEHFKEHAPRGEFVLIIEGADPALAGQKSDPYLELPIEDHLKIYINQGMRKKEAAAEVAKARGLSKRDVYKMTIDL
jgi:16S rRNA (cytidine1402-2'-O)-methyltransferase